MSVEEPMWILFKKKKIIWSVIVWNLLFRWVSIDFSKILPFLVQRALNANIFYIVWWEHKCYLETHGKLLEGSVKEGSSMGKQRFLGDPQYIILKLFSLYWLLKNPTFFGPEGLECQYFLDCLMGAQMLPRNSWKVIGVIC